MGHKVHPKAFRLNTVATWSSRWFADTKLYRTYLPQDVGIRKDIRAQFRDAGIAAVEIERSSNTVTITIRAARPGAIIGRGGQGVEDLKRKIRDKYFGGAKGGGPTAQLNIIEIDRPGLNAEVALQQIAQEIEKRLPFRRVIRQALGRIERAGSRGARIQVSGRLDGSEIARREVVMHGSVPLHTLRADIDYASGPARTIYGAIGIKVWVYRGEVFAGKAGKPESRKAL